jgi:phosphoglycolate phosphatase-like HAD superfamily hydrolase
METAMPDSETDPLPSWAEGPIKTSIIDFVSAVSREGGPDFKPIAERVACFDNDGTLWTEQPLQGQVLFAFQRAAELARRDPSLRERQPYKAFLENDLATIHALGKQGIFEFAALTHAGMTVTAFDAVVREWLTHARHPALKRPYTEVAFQPQIELLAYLRANGFKTYIVSGGEVNFMRVFAEDLYGVPPEQVIGTSLKLRFDAEPDCDLMKLSELLTFDDRETKVANISLHIGRRPILCFGNSDGDLAMLRYTLGGPGRRLSLLLHHDDAEREVAYDREFRLSPLVEALDRANELGIGVVSMKSDWKQVFTPG